MGRGARLCRDAENCDPAPVSRIDTARQQLARTESRITELESVINALDEMLHMRRSQSVASRASARSKHTPGAGKKGNKSALRDFKQAKMADYIPFLRHASSDVDVEDSLESPPRKSSLL